jgi:type IV secretory pathway VirB10-like protein
MRAGGAVSSKLIIVTSGSKLDAPYGMYKWSRREISQVSLFIFFNRIKQPDATTS